MSHNYRRGYRDGFIEAVDALEDAKLKDVRRILEILWRHWNVTLLEWQDSSSGGDASPDIPIHDEIEG